MLNKEAKDKDALALIKYIAEEDKLEKILENQQLIKTPIVRNAKLSTIGYQPDVWKDWLQLSSSGSQIKIKHFQSFGRR